MVRILLLFVLVTVLSPAEARASSVLSSSGLGPGLGVRLSDDRDAERSEGGARVTTAPLYVGWALTDGPPIAAPTRFGVAPLGLRAGSWLEARVAELAIVETTRIQSESIYLHPINVALTRGVTVAPGWLAFRGRLDLTLSLWQSTGSTGLSDRAPPLLLCGSGSIAEAIAEVLLPHDVSASVVLGVQDDPAHLDDGAECLGGGPVWQSNRWVGARIEARLASAVTMGIEAGAAAHARHTVVSEHAHAGGSGAHEHVTEQRVQGLEAGAWLAAEL